MQKFLQSFEILSNSKEIIKDKNGILPFDQIQIKLMQESTKEGPIIKNIL
jgi:hypothetical protein